MKPQTKPSSEKILRLLSRDHAEGVRDERARCKQVLRCLGLPDWWLEERHSKWISENLSMPEPGGLTMAVPAVLAANRLARQRVAFWLCSCLICLLLGASLF